MGRTTGLITIVTLTAHAASAAAAAPRGSLLGGAHGLFDDRPALIDRGEPDSRSDGPRLASLFDENGARPLVAPTSKRAALPTPVAPSARVPAAHIRHVIAQAEAGGMGYDAVQHGARVPPRRAPTDMTLGQIFDWIRATPGQPHAIGRYQFSPATLRRLVRQAGLSEHTRFSARVQDRLADMLLEEAGLARAQAGRLGRRAFMHNLAKIWAGLPTASGRSYYHGHAGNRATMSWARFDAEMAKIFPG